jgi:hypothetical protein
MFIKVAGDKNRILKAKKAPGTGPLQPEKGKWF